MTISFKSLIGVLCVILFSSCAISEKNREPNQVTGHVGRSASPAALAESSNETPENAFIRSQIPRTDFGTLNYKCNDQFFSHNFNITAVPSEIQPATYVLRAAAEIQELSSNKVVLQYLDFRKENVYRFRSSEEALKYALDNAIIIPAPIAQDILILNLSSNSLYKIKKDKQTLVTYKCIQYKQTN